MVHDLSISSDLLSIYQLQANTTAINKLLVYSLQRRNALLYYLLAYSE